MDIHFLFCPNRTIILVHLYFDQGNKYGRIRDYTILSREGGSNAQYFFQNFPGDIDAVYEDPVTYKLFMFKGE